MFRLLLSYFIYSRNAVYVMSTSVIIFYFEWVSLFHAFFRRSRLFDACSFIYGLIFFDTVSGEKIDKTLTAEQQVYEMFPWISFFLITAVLFMDVMAATAAEAAAAWETALTASKTWV